MVHLVALASSSVSLGMIVPPPGMIDALDNSIRDELQRNSHEFFIWVLISAFVVAVGVVLEGPEILHELWPSLFAWFTWTSNERRLKFERKIKKIAFFGWFLIGIGVFGEGVFEGLQNRAEGQLQTFNAILLKDARFTATTAKRSAEDAAAALDAIKRKADALDAQIDATSSAVRALSPRWLILEKTKTTFIDALKPHAGQKFIVVMCGSREEWEPTRSSLVNEPNQTTSAVSR